MTFAIGSHDIGEGRTFVIAEVAQAHDGSLGIAHSFIDAVAEAGADAVKFQTHLAEHESTPEEPWRVKFSPQDDSRYEYWRRMEFTEEEWTGLREHALEEDLVFLSSAFSPEAVDLLDRLGMPAWKVPSGEVNNRILFDAILATEKPILLSTGMSPWSEIDTAVERIREAGNPLAVLQCTSAYPCPPERIGLNVIREIAERYGCPTGLSDHSGTVYAGIAAATMGADILEAHVTFHEEMFGPDVPASVTVDELTRLVEGVRFVNEATAHPVDKDDAAGQLGELRETFTKSLVARTDLDEGTELQRRHLAAKKPGTGLPASRLDDVVGRRLRRDVVADQILTAEDLEETEQR